MHILAYLTLAAPPRPKPWPAPDDPKHPIPPKGPKPKLAALTRATTRAIALTGGWTWLALRIGIAAVAWAAIGDPYLDVQPPAVAR